jgi:glycosyltransferase involved in cell wall biosynthesis
VVRAARRHDVALIHSNTVRAHVVAALAGPLAGRPVVWTLHDRTFPLGPYRLLCRVPGKIVTVSESLRSRYLTGPTAARLVTIRNGMPSTGPPAPDGTVRQQLGIPPDAPLILHVGRLVPSKGAQVFIEAAVRVGRSRGDAHFVVVGGPDPDDRRSRDHEVELARLVGQVEVGPRVRLVGHRRDVTPYYAAADVFAYTAVEPEGLPTVILEAMHHGLPVITSAIGGATEIVTHRQTGWVVPPGDEVALAEAMMALCGDGRERARLGAAGRRQVEAEYCVDRQVERLQELYADVLTRHDDRDTGASSRPRTLLSRRRRSRGEPRALGAMHAEHTGPGLSEA